MKPYLKKTIQTYDDFAKRFQNNRKQFVMSPFFKTFQELLPSGNVLDIGCGPGRDTKMLVDAGYEAVGFDFSSGLLELACKAVPQAEFVQGDMTQLPFEDNSFDGIWSSATLHHLKVEDMKIAMKEMYRVLKSGGVVFFSTKAGEGEHFLDEEEFDGAERFFTYIDAQTCKDICTDAGFKIVEFYTKSTAEVFGDVSHGYRRAHQGFHDVFLKKV